MARTIFFVWNDEKFVRKNDPTTYFVSWDGIMRGNPPIGVDRQSKHIPTKEGEYVCEEELRGNGRKQWAVVLSPVSGSQLFSVKRENEGGGESVMVEFKIDGSPRRQWSSFCIKGLWEKEKEEELMADPLLKKALEANPIWTSVVQRRREIEETARVKAEARAKSVAQELERAKKIMENLHVSIEGDTVTLYMEDREWKLTAEAGQIVVRGQDDGLMAGGQEHASSRAMAGFEPTSMGGLSFKNSGFPIYARLEKSCPVEGLAEAIQKRIREVWMYNLSRW
jgi:hypothetical protein